MIMVKDGAEGDDVVEEGHRGRKPSNIGCCDWIMRQIMMHYEG